MTDELVMWKGEKNREVRVERFCGCGTCQSVRPEGAVGYLTGSDETGKGFTTYLWTTGDYNHAYIAFGGQE